MGKAILFSRVGAVASEFPDAVLELQSLLLRHGLEVSSVEAVGTLARRLQTGEGALIGELRAELSELFLEEDRLSYLDALGLLLAAAAGEGRAEELAYEPGLEEPVQELFRFVVEARPSRDGGEEGAGPDATEGEWLDPENAAGSAEEFVGLVSAAWERVVALEDGGRDSAGLKSLDKVPMANRAERSAEANGSILGRPLALAADDEEFGSGGVGRFFLDDEVPRLGVPEREVQRAAALPPRWIYALVAGGVVIGVLVGLLLGWQLGRRSAAPASARIAKEAAQGGALYKKPTLAVGSPATGATAQESARGNAEERPSAAALPPPAEIAGAAQGSRPAVEGPAKTSAGPVTGRSLASASAPSTKDGAAVGNLTPEARKANVSAPPEITHGQPAGSERVRIPRVEVGSAGIMAANLVASPVPAYPQQAGTAGLEGEVVVSAVVGRDGSVVEARVVSGPEALREAARKAVEGWRYRPYEIGGKAVEIITTVRIEFRLKGE